MKGALVAWGAAVGALLTGCSSKNTQSVGVLEPKSPQEAIQYVEQQDRGASRTLITAGGESFGVDINSSVRIDVDEDALRSLLSADIDPARRAAVDSLSQRIEALRNATDSIEPFVRALPEALAEWERAEISEDFGAMRAAIRRQAQLEDMIIAPLDSAIRWRLIAQGRRPDEAATEAGRIRTVARTSPRVQIGYDWDQVRDLIAMEVEFLQGELRTREPLPGLEVAIQVHRVSQTGAVAVALPGYNSEQPGPLVEIERLQFAPAAEELALHERNQELTASLGKAKSFGEALRQSLRLQVEDLTVPLDALFAAAAAFVQTAQTQLQALSVWFEAEQWETWAANVADQLEASPQGQQAKRVGDELMRLFDHLSSEIEVLNTFGTLSGQLGSLPPDVAMTTILDTAHRLSAILTRDHGDDRLAALARYVALRDSTWLRRAELIGELVDSLGRVPQQEIRAILTGPESPVTALGSAAEALRDAAAGLTRAGEASLQTLRRLVGTGPGLSAADLPVPEGQRRLDLSARALDTSFDLKTIRAGRQENDQVIVTYRFYRNGTLLATQWQDNFRVRTYGFRSRVVASIAFLVRQGESTFQPTPMLSWMASHRKWPKDRESGRGGQTSFLSYGFSTMALNFDEIQSTELGIAGTLGLLDSRVLIGGGANLQTADRRWFGFFSVSLFTTGGGLGR